MKFSTKSQYGLRGMVYLARNEDRVVPLKEISEKESISFDYLEKIFAKLEKANLIKTKRGVLGGYFLAKKGKKIKIGEIIRVLEDSFPSIKCLGGKDCPMEKGCLAKSFWKKIYVSLNKSLDSMTLYDLIK